MTLYTTVHSLWQYAVTFALKIPYILFLYSLDDTFRGGISNLLLRIVLKFDFKILSKQ
jgi:hypothetical protein